MNANDTRNPAEIERDIRTTQQDMSDTVNKLEEQLTPRNIMNTLLDKSDANGVDGRYLLDQARRNPIALGMIAIGGLWLVSDSDARASSLKPGFLGSSDDSSKGSSAHPDHDFHRGYASHMGTLEHRPEEDWDAWRRRRDHARASYLMVEPRHDEDETSFRQRLDEATDGMRQRREDAAEYARNLAHDAYQGAGNLAQDASDGASRMASKAGSLYRESPLLGGLAAALVGAVAGSLLPVTRTEEEQFGKMGSQALDQAQSKARQVGDQVKDTAHQVAEQALDKKDELIDKADQQVRDGGSGGQPARSQEFGTV